MKLNSKVLAKIEPKVTTKFDPDAIACILSWEEGQVQVAGIDTFDESSVTFDSTLITFDEA